MYTTQNFTLQAGLVRSELKHYDSRGWFIEYYDVNPYDISLERKRIRLNAQRKQCKSLAEFRVYARGIMLSLDNQLAAALVQRQSLLAPASQVLPVILPQTAVAQPVMPIANPVSDVAEAEPIKPIHTNSRYFTPFKTVVDLYIKEKQRELSGSTMRTYSCFCKQINDWVKKTLPDCQICQFTRDMACDYMEFVFEGKNSKGKKQVRKKINEDFVSSRTYNNNLKQARAFFAWAVEKCYIVENPFDKIKTKKERMKVRVEIPEDDRKRIAAYFAKRQPAMEIICHLVYTSLLRPVEITRVRVEQLDFEHHMIRLNGTQTKNGKDRAGRIDDELEALLREHIRGAKPKDFLFANGNWKPGAKAMASHSFGLAWVRMRKDLRLPDEYQLYSLRDTGIAQPLRQGVACLDMMQAAGHSDLKMTTRYADHTDPELMNRLNAKAPRF